MNEKIWHKDYQEYESWKPLRKIVQITPWAAWFAGWAPQLSNEYRYSFNNDLDQPLEDSSGSLAWFSRLRLSLLGQVSADDQISEQPKVDLSLSNINFVNIFASALEAVKMQTLETYNITITSAVITKPSWIFNELDNLLDQACLKADVEVLDKLDRAEAARLVASKAGKTKALVIEQWNYGCVMYRPYSSMNCGSLDALWVPRTLLDRMLNSGVEHNGTKNSLHAFKMHLLNEVARTRSHLKYLYANERELFDKEETTIVVPHFGSPNFTFTQSLSGANISHVEEEYIANMQLEIETMLLRDEFHSFMKDNDLPLSLDQNVTVNLAKTISHPEVASGGSWWKSIDAIIVVADFPDHRSIDIAAMRAIASIRDGECGNVFSQDFSHYDFVARGAALHAITFVENWDEHKRTSGCEDMVEDDGFFKCLNAERYERCRAAENIHDCWYEEEYGRAMVHEEL